MGAGGPRRHRGARHAARGAQPLQPRGALGRARKYKHEAKAAAKRKRNRSASRSQQKAPRRAKTARPRRRNKLPALGTGARATSTCAACRKRLRGKAPGSSKPRSWAASSRDSATARRLVALDERGKDLTTQAVRRAARASRTDASSIGGADGLDPAIKSKRRAAAAPVGADAAARARAGGARRADLPRGNAAHRAIPTTANRFTLRSPVITQIDRSIYLASRSPRRRELLEQIGVRFEVLLFREQARARRRARRGAARRRSAATTTCERVARAKAEAGWQRLEQRNLPRAAGARRRHHRRARRPDPRQAGRPARRGAHAGRAVRPRSTRAHRGRAQARRAQLECARVGIAWCEFATLRRERHPPVRRHRRADDKAGAYAIQGRAAAFVVELRGSYSGVDGPAAVRDRRSCSSSLRRS